MTEVESEQKELLPSIMQIAAGATELFNRLAVMKKEHRRKELRDSFARAAIDGVLQNNATFDADMLARNAYQVADAMLTEREKKAARLAAVP